MTVIGCYNQVTLQWNFVFEIKKLSSVKIDFVNYPLEKEFLLLFFLNLDNRFPLQVRSLSIPLPFSFVLVVFIPHQTSRNFCHPRKKKLGGEIIKIGKTGGYPPLIRISIYMYTVLHHVVISFLMLEGVGKLQRLKDFFPM